jgi:hypothetical protein
MRGSASWGGPSGTDPSSQESPLLCSCSQRGFSCSPDRIRTGATALRGRRARPLHNGAMWLAPQIGTQSNWAPTGAGVPGLEPRLTEPESVGLPITPYPIGSSAVSAPTANAPHSHGMAATSRRRGYPTRGRAFKRIYLTHAVPTHDQNLVAPAQLDSANRAFGGRTARSIRPCSEHARGVPGYGRDRAARGIRTTAAKPADRSRRLERERTRAWA